MSLELLPKSVTSLSLSGGLVDEISPRTFIIKARVATISTLQLVYFVNRILRKKHIEVFDTTYPPQALTTAKMPEEFNAITEGETVLLKRAADIGAPILFDSLSLHTPDFSQTSSTRASTSTLSFIFILSETASRSTGQTVVKPTQPTLTTELNGPPSQTGTSEVSSRGSTVSRMVPIVGGVTGAAVTIILGLIIFCILRSKRRHRALHSTSDVDISTPPDAQGQHIMSQSAQISTTPRPFLDFPFSQNCSFSKGIITGSASNSSEQGNQGNTEPAADPFNDAILTERNLPNNDAEIQRARNALDNLQVLTSQFEGEFQQLCILAQSGQLTAEDRLKLEEIKRTTGLTIPSNLRHNQRSISRSTSFESSSSLAPPSYHTCST
ncbi:hypothetical protein AGABI1DRAFT_104202 [Agaricus bisporus var. burnettii JB137-S8]|uniref:Uncharacterized protein n=1 Tax=Agaricus bisporus var. burnettii (strain JB137-S8 / ATCC MYA-4627 / FGSC 10392) TaxID=597362 RepID=K5Y7N6_AGABU|nr:uncharacterized protein AGABI1DRAFT_104202 [Agaricus bisporus var. burnettii JB137-S8]EKM84270.1 hypothetical protein AGABI1DRAFT_104202 [Agaricus bisporus var. burnettii JB137-S8]